MADTTNTAAEEWRPTGGKNSQLEAFLNKGIYNGQPIYIHFTSDEAFMSIGEQRKIASAPNADRRGQAAKVGIYLNPSTQCFSPSEAHTLLFFEEEKYRESANSMFVFAFKGPETVEDDKITSGSWVREIIYRGEIDFSVDGNATILYAGKNTFVDGNATGF